MGTYSGYAECFTGYACALEINIGACSDPDHELEELRERRALAAPRIAAARPWLAEAFEWFRGGEHPYRRHLELLDPVGRDYGGPDPGALWSSEERSRGAKLPLSWIAPGAPAASDLPGPSLGATFGPNTELHVYLYLRAGVSYRLREVLDGQFVASLFADGPLTERERAPASAAELEQTFRYAHAGSNGHTVARFLDVVRSNPDAVFAAAEGASPVDPIPPIGAAWLEPERWTPELVADAARQRTSATLLASLLPDAEWGRHGDGLSSILD